MRPCFMLTLRIAEIWQTSRQQCCRDEWIWQLDKWNNRLSDDCGWTACISDTATVTLIILILYMLIFSEGTKSYIYVYILCHSSTLKWHVGSWNASSSKLRIYLFYMLNIMGADDLAMQGARESTTMILTYLNRDHYLGPLTLRVKLFKFRTSEW